MKENWIDQLIELLIQKSDPNLPFYFKAKYIPSKIYKYVSLPFFKHEKLQCLINDKIWISSPDEMNDPYDSGLYFTEHELANKLVKDDFENFSRQIKLNEKFTPEEIEKIKIQDDIQVAITMMLKERYPEKANEIDKILIILHDFQEQFHENLTNNLNKKLKLTCN